MQNVQGHQEPQQESFVTGDFLQTYTGRKFYPASPRVADINVVDIAHALAYQCRYGGHVDRFYSVAEHCVLLSHAVPTEWALWALLHDATEAYVVDVPRPVKRMLADYKHIEGRVMAAIGAKFDLPCWHGPLCSRLYTSCFGELPDAVRDADDRILLDETAALMPRRDRWGVDNLEPLGVHIEGWGPKLAERQYLLRLAKLAPKITDADYYEAFAPRAMLGVDPTTEAEIAEIAAKQVVDPEAVKKLIERAD